METNSTTEVVREKYLYWITEGATPLDLKSNHFAKRTKIITKNTTKKITKATYFSFHFPQSTSRTSSD